MHCIEFTRFTFDLYRCRAKTFAEIIRGEHIGTAEENCGIAGSQNLLPLVIWVTVPHLTDILEKDCHRYSSGTNCAAFLCEIQNGAGVWKLIQDEFDLGVQNPALPVCVGVTNKAYEEETEE